MVRAFAFGSVAVLCAAPAFAEISVRFVEGAPKDRFVLSADSNACAMTPMVVSIDLTGSAGKLIFDVTSNGAGVEVFQPFELVSGGELLTALPTVSDGDKVIALELTGLPQESEVGFTIDVDDTIGAREITVTDSEIAGATIEVAMNGSVMQAEFGDDAVARLATLGCPS